jgi:transcriptional regulator GlxA family with amidase domain
MEGDMARSAEHIVAVLALDSFTMLDVAAVVQAARLTVQRLAAHASVSVRTFERQFRAETGLPPVRWLHQQRLLLARRLLESTDEPVERVARRAGFGSPVSLRTHFRRELGTSPLVYRRTFRRATPPDDGGVVPTSAQSEAGELPPS